VAVCGVASRPVLSSETFDPVTDFKGSADYRAAMAEVVMQRALTEAKGG
jgi:CO/xanthine dehydrogenase FAD-binding subunit